MNASAANAPQPIPLLDLREQYAAIGDEIRAAINEVLASQQFILGPQVAALEQEVARHCARGFGIGVGSGTDALVLALRACGIGRSDEVIVPAFSFIASAGAVSLLGAKPVFVDIDSHTYNIDPAQIESRITAKTRAIVPVHLYGLPADMEPILQLAAGRGLAVIEDNAQAIGATYKGRKTGSMGQLGCISFYPSKNLGAYGDAGMIVTDSQDMAARLRRLRHHGQSRKYVSEELGWNSRLDEIQAAVLRVKLRHLDGWKAARQVHAAHYNKLLAGVQGVTTPAVPPLSEHVYHQYTIRIQRRPREEASPSQTRSAPGHQTSLRDRVQQVLAEQAIASTIYYPVPLHLQPIYGSLGYKRGDFPEVERAADEVLSLPMYPELTPEQIARVAAAVTRALESDVHS